MGMLIHRHRDRTELDPPKVAEDHPAAETEPDSEYDPAAVADVYDELTDEQVADAYATNVGGRATKRDTQVAALRELDADQPTEGGSDSE
jgi:hypothetical protein